MAHTVHGEASFAFGPFVLLPGRRSLLRAGRHVEIGDRALDLLVALVLQAGQTVPRERLIALIWSDRYIGDGSLKVAASELRRVLGLDATGRPHFINHPGRGYAFVAPVTRLRGSPDARAAMELTERPLPTLPARLFGRTASLLWISTAFESWRLVSLVGPGGIGKSSVAIALAQQVRQQRSVNAVCFLDVSAVPAGVLAPRLAEALGVVLRAEEPALAVVRSLRDQHLLLVMDGCDESLDAATELVSAILSQAAHVRILITSREPLTVSGEAVHRLGPLSLPDGSVPRTMAAIAQFPAVALFLDRASASDRHFSPTDVDAEPLTALCHHLEGLPLAIELAALRVDTYTPTELAALLADPAQILRLDRRGATPRQTSLAATLEWSYQRLAAAEQRLLRQLSVRPGPVSLALVIELAGGDARAADSLGRLIAKSLVLASPGEAAERYVLPATTRAFAARKRAEAQAEPGAEVDAETDTED